MTCLPIIERELRVRARSRGVYWTRFGAALVGVLVCLPPLMWSGPFGAPAAVGRGLLDAVVGTGLLLSCSACLLTADVISSERREGTLGLLLLTRVKTFDVLVGKLGSAGLASLCALAAVLPLLMLPVLAGGVTGGEAFRKGLVLPVTMFVALSAGLWASAPGREWLKTGRTALLLVAAVVLAPSLVELLLVHSGAPGTGLGLLSPLGTISGSGDLAYKMSPGNYWLSLLLVQAVGWVLLVSGLFRLRRGWREEQGKTPAGVLANGGQRKAEAVRPLRQPLGDDADPIAWLLARQRGTLAILWAAVLLSFAYDGLFLVVFRFMGPSSYWAVVMPLGLARAAAEGALFAWAASRFFVEARRTGELELLLTTPAGATRIVSAQWGVMKRLLRWPILVLLVPTFLRVALYLATTPAQIGPAGWFGLHYAISFLVGGANIVLGVVALCWLGLWFGLRAGGQGRAIVWTVSVVKGLPVLISLLSLFLLAGLASAFSARTSWLYWTRMWLPQVGDLLYYVGLIYLAKRRLLGGLAGAELTKLELWQSILSAGRGAVAAWRRARHWTPS